MPGAIDGRKVTVLEAIEELNRRGGAQGARRRRERAAEEDAARCARLAAPGFDADAESAALRQRMAQWDAELSAAGISPGGCEDMLALTLMVTFMNTQAA